MIRSGDRVADVLPGLLESCTSLFQAPHAIMLLTRPQVGLQLDRAFGYGDAASAAHDFAQYIGDEFAWRVATDRKTQQNGSPSHPSIATPLLSGDQLLGVLAVYPVAAEAADAKRIALFESLAADTSITLEMSRLIDENDRLSPIDPLTSALKQATFMDLADREFRRSWRFDQPLTAILLDVDGMHDINVKRGRAFGDEVLRHVASACRSTIRAFDLIARYDQDTFAILLVMADQTGGRTAAERIRMAVGSMDLRDATGPLRVTASFGVCSYPHEGCASIFDLLDLAQSALKATRRL